MFVASLSLRNYTNIKEAGKYAEGSHLLAHTSEMMDEYMSPSLSSCLVLWVSVQTFITCISNMAILTMFTQKQVP